jgi:hypothetical protein
VRILTVYFTSLKAAPTAQTATEPTSRPAASVVGMNKNPDGNISEEAYDAHAHRHQGLLEFKF